MSKTNYLNAGCLCLFVFLALGVPVAEAQVNCAAGNPASPKLICLIPNTVVQGADSATGKSYTLSPSTVASPFKNSFGFLTADIGGEISQIPLASPASGIVFVTDPTLHVPVPSNDSLGPILTQRADSIGRHKFYIATTYQYFLLEDVDGISLKGALPSAFPLTLTSNPNPTTPDAIAFGNSRIDLKVHQFVGYATYGLTSRIDVSVAVPVLRVDMRYTINQLTSTIVPTQLSNAEEATGIGDIVVAAKGNLWKFGRGGGVAIGVEMRLPTGDAENFLGSGTVGARPFVTFAYGRRISPHFNFAYQLNGNTELVTNSVGANALLPNRLLYSGGADWRVIKKLTFAVDILEQRVIDSQRAVIKPNSTSFTLGTSTLTPANILSTTTGSYNRTDASGGIKVNPIGNLLFTGNLTVALDHGGLRARLAPLFGVSYTF